MRFTFSALMLTYKYCLRATLEATQIGDVIPTFAFTGQGDKWRGRSVTRPHLIVCKSTWEDEWHFRPMQPDGSLILNKKDDSKSINDSETWNHEFVLFLPHRLKPAGTTSINRFSTSSTCLRGSHDGTCSWISVRNRTFSREFDSKILICVFISKDRTVNKEHSHAIFPVNR